MKKNQYLVAVFLIIFSLIGCVGMSETQQRTLSGGVIGAGAGAGLAAATGGNAGLEQRLAVQRAHSPVISSVKKNNCK